MPKLRNHNSSPDDPSTGPPFRLLLIAVIVVVITIAIMNWPQASALAYVNRIELKIQHAVGL